MSIAKPELPDQLTEGSRENNMRRSAAVLLSAPAIVAGGAVLAIRGALKRGAEPITAEPTDLCQIDQGVMVIKKEDEAAVLAAGKRTLDFQQAHPDVFYYTRTRIYLAPYVNADGTIDPTKELLTFFDEFDNYPVYFASLLTTPIRRPQVLRLARGFLKYAQVSDPRSHRGHITWNERQDMRVNVESRKPLYPACGGGKTPTDDVIMAEQNVAVIKTADKANALAAIGARLAYERDNPDQFYFTRARVFTAPYPRDRTKQMLMVFYECDDHDKHRESFANAAATDDDYRALAGRVSRNVLDDPETRVTTWTEQQELRVRYEFREPLYPSCDEGGAHVPVRSLHQPAAKSDARGSAPKADRRTRRTPARQVITNLIGKVPSALAAQVALGVENVVAALQTQDSTLLAESVDLGVRRTTRAVVNAALDQP